MTNSLRKKPLHKYGRPVNPDRKIHNREADTHRAMTRLKVRLVYIHNLQREEAFRAAHADQYSISMINRLIEQRKHLK